MRVALKTTTTMVPQMQQWWQADAGADSGFEALLDTLEPLVKAIPPMAPAPASEGPKPKMDGDGKPVLDDKGQPVMEGAAAPATVPPAATAKEEPFGKSFTVKLEDGTETEVLDATEMMKALNEKNVTLGERCGRLEAGLRRTLAVNAALNTHVTEQAVMIKSLQADVTRIGATPAGRRTVLNVLEKPATTVAPPATVEGVTAEKFMGTMMKCFESGKISGSDVTIAEASLGRGVPIPDEIVARVTAAAGS